MEPIYTGGNIFTRDSRQRSDIFFFFKNTFTDYFSCGKSRARKTQFITIEWKNQNISIVYLSIAKRVLYWTFFFYGSSSRFSGLCHQPEAETSN